MSLKNNSFQFGDFVLDADERVLRQDGKPLLLPPKAFRLLSVLLENRGRIVEKDELMRRVWEDAFVEEANITYTIRLLRKTLGDDRHNPRFFETVPRRGYRFIADVQVPEHKEDDEQAKNISDVKIKDADVNLLPRQRYWLLFPILAVLLILTGASWYMWIRRSRVPPIFPTTFSSQKLTTDGRVPHAVISPDGKAMIFVVENEESSSVWLRQLETGNNVNLIPATNDRYGGIAISPDGNYLYFARAARIDGKQFDIYRTTIFGGVPSKIVAGTQGWTSVSPDGSRLSFVRCPYNDNEFCSLWVADSADGGNQQKLVSRSRPMRISANQFSSDGREVIFASGQSENGSNEFNLFEADITSGAEKRLLNESFFDINSVSRLLGTSDLLITAKRIPEHNFRIWRVSADSDVVPLTDDSETYSMVSSDRTGEMLTAVRSESDMSLSLRSLSEPYHETVLEDAVAAGASVSFADNEQILLSSTVSGNGDIWSIQKNGIGKRQLTNDPGDDISPVLSRNDQIIYFASNRSGQIQIWRMNADGSDQTQLTQTDGGFPLSVSPNGKWVYYQHGLTRELWRLETDSLSREKIYSEHSYKYAISPDGTKAALAERSNDGKATIRIISIPGGEQAVVFSPEKNEDPVWEIEWSPDGSAILYSQHNLKDRSSTIIEQPFGRGRPKVIANIHDSFVYCLSMSQDLKTLAVVHGRFRRDAVLLNVAR